MALGDEVVVQLLDPRLVRERRMIVRGARPRLRRIRSAPTMHLVEALGRRVVRLDVVVRDRPGRRDATVVPQLAEVLASQPEERRAVELRVPADIIVGVWVQLGAGGSTPRLLRVVAALLVHRERAPVLRLTPDVVT